MSTPRSTLAAAAVGGKIYAIGGQLSTSVLSTVEAYDPASNAWTPKASMPTPRSRMAIAVVGGILYAIGGCTDFECNGFVGTVEAYDPASDTWTTKASMPTARRDLSAAVLNGKVYAIGGAFGPGCSLTAAVEEYDPAANSWVTRAPLPAARNTLAAGSLNGFIYAVGGANCSATLATAEAYSASTDSWSAVDTNAYRSGCCRGRRAKRGALRGRRCRCHRRDRQRGLQLGNPGAAWTFGACWATGACGIARACRTAGARWADGTHRAARTERTTRARWPRWQSGMEHVPANPEDSGRRFHLYTRQRYSGDTYPGPGR